MSTVLSVSPVVESPDDLLPPGLGSSHTLGDFPVQVALIVSECDEDRVGGTGSILGDAAERPALLLDLANDGVVYAEVRSPLNSTSKTTGQSRGHFPRTRTSGRRRRAEWSGRGS